MNVDSGNRRVAEEAPRRWSSFEGGLPRRLFLWAVERFELSPLARQRTKVVYFGWAYWRLFMIPGIPAWRLVRQFLRIDFNVLHAHLPSETVILTRALSQRRAHKGAALVEAGCWQGGSSTKFSILCELFGYSLMIFDSFEGVEVLNAADQAKEWDYAGQYASAESVLWENLKRYGKPGVCVAFKGWFSETLAACPIQVPIVMVYIDCDLGKGTYEVLRGTSAALVKDGCIFTQDFHIAPVRAVLLDPETWRSLEKPFPNILSEGPMLARIDWSD